MLMTGKTIKPIDLLQVEYFLDRTFYADMVSSQ